MNSIKEQPLIPGHALLVLTPEGLNFDPLTWIEGNRIPLKEKLLEHGGLLLRNFALKDVDDFNRFAQLTFGKLIEYNERSSPRNRVDGNIYTSTEYSKDQSIFLHNENSYQKTFPLRIGFFCAQPAARGGETPVADSRKIYDKIPEAIRQKFVDRKILYVRNFRDNLGLSWQTVFQTQEKAAVEKYCRNAGIQVEWKRDGGLRTRQVRPAVARHPQSNVMTWFNHATFFHISTLPPWMRDMLLEEYAEEDLPNNTYYGDGSRIEDSVMDELREVYKNETLSFGWEKGDLLLLENMLIAHGRAPYEGERKVLVAMADSCTLDEA